MSGKVRDPYEDLYDRPRPQSKYHHPMPMAKRAAQFLPFDALTGYKELIAEEARTTEHCLCAGCRERRRHVPGGQRLSAAG